MKVKKEKFGQMATHPQDGVIIRNVQQDLAAKYDKVVVAVIGKKAYEKVERELSKSGLLGIERVEVIMV